MALQRACAAICHVNWWPGHATWHCSVRVLPYTTSTGDQVMPRGTAACVCCHMPRQLVTRTFHVSLQRACAAIYHVNWWPGHATWHCSMRVLPYATSTRWLGHATWHRSVRVLPYATSTGWPGHATWHCSVRVLPYATSTGDKVMPRIRSYKGPSELSSIHDR